MDFTTQGGQDILVEELVNIPIEMAEKLEILKVRNSNGVGMAGQGKQPQGLKVSKE